MKKITFTLLTAFSLLLVTVGKVSAQTAKIQIIHNSPDYIIDSVDVWANDVRIANDLPFRKATQMIAIDSGNYVITIAKKFSTDTTAATSLLKVDMFRIDSGKTYLAFIAGVVDTTQYATNPAGLDRSLSFMSTDAYNDKATANRVALFFANGTPDAAAFDLNKIGTGAVKYGDDIAYGDISDSSVVTLANHVLNLTSADSTKFEGAFKLRTTLSGKVGVVFTSGVYAATGNPTPAKAMKVLIAYTDGSVTELSKITADIQILHNSADTNAKMVDVYMNGVKTLAGFGFRNATPYTAINALVPCSIAVAPNNSNSVADAFYTTVITPDSFTNYYAIATGVRTPNTTHFAVNPNGKDIGFKIVVYKGARKTSTYSKNVDLLYFHGVTDLQATTIRGVNQIQFLSKNDSYLGFHGYASHSALDDVQFEVSDAAADTVMTSAFGYLMKHQGQAGLVFTSGFKQFTKIDTSNNTPIAPVLQLDSAKLYVLWPNGDVDTMISKWSVGLNERAILSQSLAVYPNPANRDLHVTFESKQSKEMTIELMDITGKVILSQKQNMIAGSNDIKLNVSDLNNGLYIVTLVSDQQKLTTKVNVLK